MSPNIFRSCTVALIFFTKITETLATRRFPNVNLFGINGNLEGVDASLAHLPLGKSTQHGCIPLLDEPKQTTYEDTRKITTLLGNLSEEKNTQAPPPLE